MLHRAIISAVFDRTYRDFDVELWDGRKLGPRAAGRNVAGRLVVRTPDAVACLVPPLDERAIAEAFLDGRLDIVGDTVSVLEAIACWEGPRLVLAGLPMAAAAWTSSAMSEARRIWSAPRRRHSIARDGRAVRRHYDVSNEFYELFLDERLVYSCGYFATGSESLDEAQEAKLELSCRKIGLRQGERLLDVGCGWGALLLHAAQHFDAQAIGTTVSRLQYTEARRRAVAAGVESRVQVLDCDYRQLPADPVDKIVSIGMMEHVGRARLDEYFGQLYRRLRPGGLLLNHAIADIAEGVRTMPWACRPFRGFIDREIFPDSDLPPLGMVIRAAERQGFEVRDVECLREHYAQTLEHWLARLERRFDEATAQVGSRTARAFRLYLGVSAVAFRIGRIGIYQTLLAKRSETGEAKGVPRSRHSWQSKPLARSALLPATV